MRFWTFMAGVALGLAIGAAARDGWMAVGFGVGAAFCWFAPQCWPPEDGIESFRAARKALRGGE